MYSIRQSAGKKDSVVGALVCRKSLVRQSSRGGLSLGFHFQDTRCGPAASS